MSEAEERVYASYKTGRPGDDPAGFSRRTFADQLSIETPEQVALSVPVAGIGSRFVALLLDHLLQCGALLAVVLLFALFHAAVPGAQAISPSGKWFLAMLGFGLFLLFWGYFSLFEAFWQGQTPGKRMVHLRVIKDGGRPITLFESLARNLLRVADYLPSLYLAGLITMLANKQNKRLGDFAAGTLVIHERETAQGLLLGSHDNALRHPAAGRDPSPNATLFPANAVRHLQPSDLVLIESFFARALDLPLEVRAAMASRILQQLTARMGVELPTTGSPERQLEELGLLLRGLPRGR